MMNEQFSELYHLAWNYSEFDDEYKKNPTYERRCVVQSRIFAELLVSKCASIVADAVDHREPASTYVGKIKEHFGIN